MGSIIFGLWLIFVAKVFPLGIAIVCWGIIETTYMFALKKRLDILIAIVHKLHKSQVMTLIASNPHLVDMVINDTTADDGLKKYVKDIDTEISELAKKMKEGKK